MITLPFSWQHADGSTMVILADWAQRIVTLRPVDATVLSALPWPYLFHIVFGMTIFLLFPFSRLVHVWSGFATISFLFRPHQVVRSRRLNVPVGHNEPRQPGARV
jgi:nitrate reductase gamma subunit